LKSQLTEKVEKLEILENSMKQQKSSTDKDFLLMEKKIEFYEAQI